MEGRELEGVVVVGVDWLLEFEDVARKNLVTVCKREVEL